VAKRRVPECRVIRLGQRAQKPIEKRQHRLAGCGSLLHGLLKQARVAAVCWRLFVYQPLFGAFHIAAVAWGKASELANMLSVGRLCVQRYGRQKHPFQSAVRVSSAMRCLSCSNPPCTHLR